MAAAYRKTCGIDSVKHDKNHVSDEKNICRKLTGPDDPSDAPCPIPVFHVFFSCDLRVIRLCIIHPGIGASPFAEAIAVNCQLYADFAMRKRFWYFRRTYCWIFR